MSDRRPSFADMLSPEQIRQYMTEAGYAQPQTAPLPPPPDVPAQPPPQLVEFRGVIEFQAHWEIPAVTNRSRDDLISDIMQAMSGAEAPWLPRLRYHVSQLTRIDPGARPMAPASDSRQIFTDPRGLKWYVNPDGSLEPLSGGPPMTMPNGWMVTPESVPAEARREMHVAMHDMARQETSHAGRIDGLERLAAALSAQLDAMESERTHRRAARAERRLHRGDLPADGDGAGALPDTPLRQTAGPGGDGGTGSEPAAHDLHPGDDGGGHLDDRDQQQPAPEAEPDIAQKRPDRRERKPALGGNDATSHLPKSEQ